MSKRLTDEKVAEVLHRVLGESGNVHTLNLLFKLISKRMSKEHPTSGLTRARLRRVAALDPNVHLDIRTREDDRTDLPTRCPVCSSGLDKVKNKTLYGWEVTIERNCPVCGYWTGKKRRVPTYYVFSLRE